RKTPSFSVNEQVILTIEVATPRWFTGGTRIGNIEIPNVIAKQRNQLATNFTEQKEGQTWSRQRWEVTLYPQASGDFVIPPVAVGVQVSAP
ncbi:BatD family protein, partial [Escherichia coli]|nr:BatD family protein [Escherichia coli]